MSEVKRVGRVVITVRTPDPPAGNCPFINGRVADWTDLRVDVVTDDGERVALPGVCSVTFTARDGNGEPLRAVIEVMPATLELEAIAELIEVVHESDDDVEEGSV